jgi:filamentous hemagglutinin family protein
MNLPSLKRNSIPSKIRFPICGKGLVYAFLIYPILGLAAPPQPVIPQNALPTGGVVAAGSASIAQAGNTLNIQQSSQNAVINWGTFNVGAQAQVNFNQPNAQSATLNRVHSATPSIINGAIQANGQVAIVNSNGIVFGKNAQVNASAIVASTMDVSDDQFMAGGTKTFRGNPNSTSKIINRGSLTAQGLDEYSYYTITNDDLDMQSASQPAVVTYNVYGSISKNFDAREYPLFVSAGGSYEFSPDENTGLSRWLIWAKLGFSF